MLSHKHTTSKLSLCKNISLGSQQGPVLVEETAPLAPLFSPHICQRRMSSLITEHEKVGLALNEHPDHLKVGVAGPTGVVEGVRPQSSRTRMDTPASFSRKDMTGNDPRRQAM